MPVVESFIQGPVDGVGKKVETVKVTTSQGDVERETAAVSDPEVAAARANVRNAMPGSTDYGLVTRSPEPGSATVATVDQNASSVTVLAANAARRGFVIYNDSEAGLVLKFGTAASLTDFTRALPPRTSWERHGGYTGVITGIWDAAGAGKARVTEES